MATRKALDGMSTADLVAHYNKRSGKKPIKGFHTRKKGIEQILALSTAKKPRVKPPVPTGVQKKRDAQRAAKKHPGVIRMLVSDNPKRKDTKAHAKFEELLAMDGWKVEDFYGLEGTKPKLDDEKGWPRIELRWAVKKGWAKVEKA